MNNQISTTTNPAVKTDREREQKHHTVGWSTAVAVTADLPMLPEIRDRTQSVNWCAALSNAGHAAFLATVAGIGSGTTAIIQTPTPAIPPAGSTSTISHL